MNRSLVVKIRATGPTGRGTSVTTEDGKEIKGIKSLSVTLHPLHSNVATIELFTNDVEAEAQAEFQMIHPGTGKMAKLKRIEFEDGSVWPPQQSVDIDKLKYLLTRCDAVQPKIRDPFRYYICTRDCGHGGPCAVVIRDRREDENLCTKRWGILGTSCRLTQNHPGPCECR